MINQEDLELPTGFEEEPTDLQVDEMCNGILAIENINGIFRVEPYRFFIMFKDDSCLYGIFSNDYKYVRFSKT